MRTCHDESKHGCLDENGKKTNSDAYVRFHSFRRRCERRRDGSVFDLLPMDERFHRLAKRLSILERRRTRLDKRAYGSTVPTNILGKGSIEEDEEKQTFDRRSEEQVGGRSRTSSRCIEDVDANPCRSMPPRSRRFLEQDGSCSMHVENASIHSNAFLDALGCVRPGPTSGSEEGWIVRAKTGRPPWRGLHLSKTLSMHVDLVSHKATEPPSPRVMVSGMERRHDEQPLRGHACTIGALHIFESGFLPRPYVMTVRYTT